MFTVSHAFGFPVWFRGFNTVYKCRVCFVYGCIMFYNMLVMVLLMVFTSVFSDGWSMLRHGLFRVCMVCLWLCMVCIRFLQLLRFAWFAYDIVWCHTLLNGCIVIAWLSYVSTLLSNFLQCVPTILH